MTPARPVLSVLDLVPVSAGRSRADALREMVELARAADAAGLHRYWIAEHHGSTTFLAAATSVLMGQVLASTERIGVASGGIMLPNHPPLVIAEQVGTLAALYPGRVGLGLGRAPGTDPVTASALRRREADPSSFADEVVETLTYLTQDPGTAGLGVPGSLLPSDSQSPTVSVTVHADAGPREAVFTVPDGIGRVRSAPDPVHRVRAVPGEGTRPQTWILGSSVNGARVAGSLGLPFAVASHFAPAQAEAAITSYRSVFASAQDSAPSVAGVLSDGQPHVAAGVNVMVAPTEQEATRLFSTAMACTARILGGRPGPLDEPVASPEAWRELAGGKDIAVTRAMALSFVGTPDDVASRLHALAERWGLDELLVVTYAHDAAARRRSYELLARAW
ncbi:LLM class flavin-dependent oxidoreductase [Actinomyces howellii]|uniref:Alkanal monooxygenase alpha chain n=1 Tax=Actinomyces howellii TaxID=52771 RepID=A0A3S4RGX0_9ACTO|nr:LLM class flavin-dependent oxidoreductase [Actinomyces howellii]VEG29782.1 Alkanal monooxygenase alpha chain [Actinomyces howellii]